ncbi:pig-Q [Coemansia biformis]|uniref:Pig-Q n=1 Tax=Coemansia biformis TaxID=1286918 RepID=A0A9W8D1N5_9FUNG|nr:pig-Q [Coemansia biformis]
MAGSPARVASVPAASGECMFRIFWPVHLCRRLAESGYLVGWVLGEGVVVVASKTAFANAAQVAGYLAGFHRLHTASQGAEVGLRLPPTIVGYLSREGEGLCEPEPRDRSPIWIDAFTARTQVAFRDVLSFGEAMPRRAIVTIYEESIGKPWHFYSAAPLNLDLTVAQPAHAAPLAAAHAGQLPLQHILDYANMAGQLYEHIHEPLRVAGAPAAAGSTPHSGQALSAWACDVFLVFAAHFLRVADMRIFGHKVKRFSAVGQQLDLIVRRSVHLAEQWRAARGTTRAVHGQRRTAQYAYFWNSVWVTVLDVALGCILGACLIAHAGAVSDWIVAALRQQTVTSLEQTIVWLRGWPAGLKLNNGLDGFLAELFLWLIHFWTVVFQPSARHLRAVVIVAGWSGFVGGCSMQLAVLSDALALSTVHTYWFYMVAARIFHWQLVTLYSLFNLFRGRKQNVLRRRIDSCDYNLDQLLIGTILFTLLTYLFPTVLVYYITFASRRLAVTMAHGLLEVLLGILNHCPVFYVALRLRDPQMFPGGVCYNVDSQYAHRFIEAAWVIPGSPVRLARDPIPLSAQHRLNVTVVHMGSVPLLLPALFFQYYQIWVQFSASYLTQGLLRSLVLGDVIRPVPRLQHTMIPGLSHAQPYAAVGAPAATAPCSLAD